MVICHIARYSAAHDDVQHKHLPRSSLYDSDFVDVQLLKKNMAALTKDEISVPCSQCYGDV